MIKLLADGGLIAILLISAAAGLHWIVKRQPKLSVLAPYVIMAGLTSLLVGKLISFWQPETLRPFMKAGVEAGAAYMDNPGFPSDHALLATAVVLAVFMMTPYKKLSLGLIVLVAVMSIARVVALVHTPLDIAGGILAGLAGVGWYWKYKNLPGIKAQTNNRKQHTVQ